LVMTTISILLTVFNVKPFLNKNGLDYGSLMAFCLIWGMGGAFISLALSKVMAKWMMGVKIIDPNTNDAALRSLVDLVHRCSQQAGLKKMPEVGVYNSPEVNAFATGATKSSALVAVSSGLLNKMRREGLEGVIGHEVAHIANGDMVTMTLVQGVVNAFVMFAARVLAFVIMRGLSSSRDRDAPVSPFAYQMVVFVLQMVFMVFGSIAIASFSRFREFRADAGGARLAGRDKMIYALQSLKQLHDVKDPASQQEAFQALKISNASTMLKIFATHPPLDERIARLQKG
jgi:heat shock protein HtpX